MHSIWRAQMETCIKLELARRSEPSTRAWLTCSPSHAIYHSQHKIIAYYMKSALANLPLLAQTLAVVFTHTHHSSACSVTSDARRDVIAWMRPLQQWDEMTQNIVCFHGSTKRAFILSEYSLTHMKNVIVRTLISLWYQPGMTKKRQPEQKN